MLHTLRALRSWPLWFRLLLTGGILGVFSALQLPLENEVPGDPFLLFSMVVIGSTLMFGERVGFFAVALSTFLSFFFFEPLGTLAITHAADLIKIELYAILASASVLAVAQVGRTLVGALTATQSLEQSDRTRSILLRELAHRVANNFAIVATLIRTKADAVSDPQAKLVLNEACEQVTVMARLHRLLHADDEIRPSTANASFPNYVRISKPRWHVHDRFPFKASRLAASCPWLKQSRWGLLSMS